MIMLITAAALAAGQPAPAPAPMAMPMPAGHEMPMTDAEHAAMKENAAASIWATRVMTCMRPRASRTTNAASKQGRGAARKAAPRFTGA